MARLITCGYEENDLLATMWTSVAGTAPTIVTSGPTPHSGTYCLLTSAVSGASNVRRSLATAKTSGSLFPRFYWQTPAALPGANTILFSIANSGATVAQTLQLLTTGAVQLTNSVTAATANTVTGIAASTWYRIELDLLIHATAGSVTLRIYLGDTTGTPPFTATISGVNTLSTNAAQFWVGRTSGTTQFAYDDFAVNDDTLTVQTANPGPEKIALMQPNADVSIAWTKAGSSPASTNWDGVNDVPGTPDDAVTFNETSGILVEDVLGLTPLAGVPANAIITWADVYARHQAATASMTLILGLRDEQGASFHPGAAIPLTNGTWTITPTGGQAGLNCLGKSVADLNAFKVMYQDGGASGIKRVSAIWMNVSWIDGPALPPPPLLINTAPMRAASW